MTAIDFYLYFPSQDAPQRAREACEADAESIMVRLVADDLNWLTLVRIDVPRGGLDDAERRFQELAERHGGEYDGYERPVSDD